MFLPTTLDEIRSLGWDDVDVILVSGDTYIDSPSMGVAIIGKVLLKKGFRVAIIAQPDISGPEDIIRLGEPKLFWGISSGAIDSMVANYTASGKFRKKDDLTPGGINNRRPNRALIAYANHIKKHFKNTAPIVIGGIEASLRRIAHYDFWSNSIRRSVLLDSKADILVYGMAEKSTVLLAEALRDGKDYTAIPGICFMSKEPVDSYISLPSYEEVSGDINAFTNMFQLFYNYSDPFNGKGVQQKYGDRFLIQNKVPEPLDQKELDAVYDLDYERKVHPYYKKMGAVRALDTIQFSITSHRGCYGECNFCAIAIHQGKNITSRSESSIIREAESFLTHCDFKGIISDVGGPTANMYGFDCQGRKSHRGCKDKRCVYPQVCKGLQVNHKPLISLMKRMRRIEGIKKVFIASGVRYDLILADNKFGEQYLEELIKYHISGQLKIAPEHSEKEILNLMGKSSIDDLLKFREMFIGLNKKHGLNQFLTYYFIAAHPGSNPEHMKSLKRLTQQQLKINPEQVQIFTPVPSTYSTLMYYTGKDPFTGRNIFIEKDKNRKEKQKEILTVKKKKN